MQNDSIDNLRLDLNRERVRGVIYVRSGDTRARTIHITLVENGKPLDLSNAVFCELLIHKPDGNENDQTMVRYGNELQYTFRTQDINVPGECKCMVQVTFADDAIVTSPEFAVMVYDKVIDPSHEMSTNEYTAISQILIDVTNLKNQAEDDVALADAAKDEAEYYAGTVQGIAEDSESWAVGTRGGEDVPPEDPAYNNNSKYYANHAREEAHEEATNAEAWAVGQRDGSDIPATDPAYENHAKYWAEQAEASLTNTVRSFNGRNGVVVPESGDYDLTDMGDVNVTSPTDGQGLRYDALSGKWVNGDAASAVSNLTDVNLTSLADGEILKYDSESEKWVNTADLNGHVIENQDGTDMTQRGNVQFADAFITDDSVNGRTIVENIKEVSPADYASTTDEGIIVTDDGEDALIGAVSDDYVEVTADGNKTLKALLQDLYDAMDRSKITEHSCIKRWSWSDGYSVHNLVYGESTFYRFTSISINGDNSGIVLASNNRSAYYLNGTEDTTTKPSSGLIIRLYYGNKKATVDLQTTANRCWMGDGTTVQQALTVTKSQITPNVGVVSGQEDRNIYYTDKRTFIKYSFLLDSRTTAIADGTKIFDFPNDIDLSHLSVQYSIAKEIKNAMAHIVYCTNQGIYLDGNTTAQSNNYLTGSIYIHLV